MIHEPCTVRTMLEHVAKQLHAVLPTDELAQQYARWIIAWALNISTSRLMIDQQCILDRAQIASIEQAVDRMVTHHEPLAYIIGTMPFGNLTVRVRPPVLIPRPETEEWCIALIECWKSVGVSPRRILDIGTGSGCIALALADAFPESVVVGIDMNEQAVVLAQENSVMLGIPNVSFVCAQWPWESYSGEPFDLIVSNPPYIDPVMAVSLDRSVRDWEDPRALYANEQGRAMIDSILMHAPRMMRASVAREVIVPTLAIEIDVTQGAWVCARAKELGWQHVGVQQDQAGRDRVVTATGNNRCQMRMR